MENLIVTIIGNMIGIPIGMYVGYKIYIVIEKFKKWNYEEWSGSKY